MTARQQLAHEFDDAALAVALGGAEGHAKEVELHARAALDDGEVVVELRIGIGVADHDPRRIGAFVLEDPQLIQPDR